MRFIMGCRLKIKRIIIFSMAAVLLFGFGVEATELAIEDWQCLECHQDGKLKQPSAGGDVRSLHVDPEAWNQDVHHNKNIKCIDCHLEVTPVSHPKEGARRAACERCHPEACEEYQSNLHNVFMGAINDPLPECYDCHTKHNVRLKADPESTIHEKNLGKTCGSCHEDKLRTRFAMFLPTSLLLGHRKCDVNEKLDLSICINCHGDAGHGSLTAYPEYCDRCHNTKKMASSFSATHTGASFLEHPVRFFLERAGLVLNVALVGACIAFIIPVGRFYRSRKRNE